MAARIAHHLGYRVIAVDRIPERLARAQRAWHRPPSTWKSLDEPVGDAVRSMTDGRGTDSVIDAVGMEATRLTGGLGLAEDHRADASIRSPKPMMQTAGVDRLDAFYSAIDIVRRGGTISLIGVYGGMADPLPMLTLFDKQIQLRMGQANVKKWVGDILPLLGDERPFGRRRFRHAPAAARRSAPRLRHLPEEEGRRRQNHPEAVGVSRGRLRAEEG